MLFLYLFLLPILGFATATLNATNGVNVGEDTVDAFRANLLEGNWVDYAQWFGFEFPDREFNVLDFGAKPNGVENTTTELQAALDACFESGGGTVLIPAGTYLSGALFIKSNTHLKLAEGTTLIGSVNINDFPLQPTRVAGVEMLWPVALLNVNGASNVRISGLGVINGRGKPFWSMFHEMKPYYEAAGLRWALDYDARRPRMLIVNNSENVHIGEVTFMHSPFWTVHLLYSRHITVDGITIRNRVENQHAPSSDGVDVDSCEYVLIQNCDIESNDDNICLKSGRDADGLRVNRPCRYVRIRNNLTRRGAALITFGSETSGGINHVYISDMEANGTTRGIRFKSAKTRGGIVEKILIERVIIQKVPFVFEFTLNWNPDYSYARLPEGYDRESLPAHWKTLLEPVVPAERGIGKLRDIVISNLEAKKDCWKAFYVVGFLESPINNIVFHNCHVSTETAGEISHVRNWKAFESTFSFKDGKPPALTNASGIDPTFLGGDTD